MWNGTTVKRLKMRLNIFTYKSRTYYVIGYIQSLSYLFISFSSPRKSGLKVSAVSVALRIDNSISPLPLNIINIINPNASCARIYERISGYID